MDLFAWFRRRRPTGTIDQLLTLARATDEPAQRAAYIDLLHDQVAVLHDTAGDAAQRAVTAMELRLSDQLLTQFGVTNEMISQAVSHARGAEEGTAGLQDQMLILEGSFSTFGESLNQLRIEFAELSNDVAVLREEAKRQQRINERTEERLTDHTQRIAALEAYAASVPPEERQQLIATIGQVKTQLTELLARERGGDGGSTTR